MFDNLLIIARCDVWCDVWCVGLDRLVVERLGRLCGGKMEGGEGKGREEQGLCA